jgi:phosphoribosylformylglycinamidine (FGAM) synthase-like enzyme
VAAIVKERVNSFLEHALFVADDDLRRFELEQVPQTVVPVDDAAVEVVQVRRGETSAFEWDERAQVGRDDGEHFEHHPLGARAAVHEALAELEALGEFLAVLL